MGFFSDLIKGKRPEMASKSLFDLFPEMEGQYQDLADQFETGFAGLFDFIRDREDQAMSRFMGDYDAIGSLMEESEGVYEQGFSSLMDGFRENFAQSQDFLQQATDVYRTEGRDATLADLEVRREEELRRANAMASQLGLGGSTIGGSLASSVGQQFDRERGMVRENYASGIADRLGAQSRLAMEGGIAQSNLMRQGLMDMQGLRTNRANFMTGAAQGFQSLFQDYGQPLLQAQQQQFEAPLNLMTNMRNLGYGRAVNYNNARQGGIGGQLVGMAAGALMSDRRLKDNVKEIKKHHGLGIYSWNWSEKAKEFGYEGESRGFMADEVEKKYPHIVSSYNGYKTVNYKELLEEFSKEEAMFAGSSRTEIENGNS